MRYAVPADKKQRWPGRPLFLLYVFGLRPLVTEVLTVQRMRRKAPVSSLRVRLNERLRDKDDWTEPGDVFMEQSEPFILVALFKQMHRFLIIKITIAVAVVLVSALLFRGGYSWSRPVVEALQHVTSWNLGLESVTGKALPAFRSAWDNWKLPAFLNNQNSPEGGLPPLAGKLQCQYGLRENPLFGHEEMHYGIDLVAPEGTAVNAVLEGRVISITEEQERYSLIVEHHSGWQTVYCGLGDVVVEEGEMLSAGNSLGRLSGPVLYEQPHLHFELRWKGRPVEPPSEWVALFAESTI